jgi:response regulator RpfG family c-di-GMP phosphodiesterase
LSRAKILLAEDDRAVLVSLERLLHGQGGFEVETATDGQEALEKAHTFQPDLIISDYSMPSLNGFELCKEVKSTPKLAGAMFVVLTGFTDPSLKVSGLNLGVDDYLTKPVETAELLAKVRATLRIKTLHDELRSDKEQLQRLHRELRDSFDNLSRVFVRLLDLRIPDASTRGERLMKRARAVARRMKVPGKYIRDMDVAAQLREIGKLVAPANDSDEWHYLVASKAILEQVSHFVGAAEVIGSIRENWDGTGYPDHRLQGQIPVRSRILRVLIDFESGWEERASTTPNVTPDHVLEDLRRYVGTRYDPLIVTQLEMAIATSPGTDWHLTKRRVGLKELDVGMVLAEDLCTSSGVKLLSRGAQISTTTLELIRRRHTSDPIIFGACVEVA